MNCSKTIDSTEFLKAAMGVATALQKEYPEFTVALASMDMEGIPYKYIFYFINKYQQNKPFSIPIGLADIKQPYRDSIYQILKRQLFKKFCIRI